MGGEKGYRRKGFGVFLRLLPFLAERNLKGILVNYGHPNLWFANKREKRIWRTHKKTVRCKTGKVSPSKVRDIMESSRFGLFPNTQDCSPLLLSESLIRDIPVLVNHDILGGWKYVNEDTGRFFTDDNVVDSIDEVLHGDFSPSGSFMSYYGFENSSRRLAAFVSKHFKGMEGCEMACFDGLSKLLRRYV